MSLIIFYRRDSFISHRAFCDALEEDNIRVDEGLRDSKTRNFKGENPQLIMPVSGNNTSMIKSSFAQDFIPMPIKSMRMADVGMFSSNSGPVFGLIRSIPSSPASLQLSHDSPGGSSAHMSATVLLQKATQMGVTSSCSINSTMMQQSFIPNMRSFGQLQQTQMVGIDEGGHAKLKNFNGDGNTTTVDFLGIDGQRALVGLHEKEFETISQQMLQSLHAFHQPMAHGHAAIGKPMWDV